MRKSKLNGHDHPSVPRPEVLPQLSISLSVLTKLGSIAVHADEFTSPGGHPADSIALRALIQDPEVQQLLKEMGEKALIPVKRK